jgi:hypothetical protein
MKAAVIELPSGPARRRRLETVTSERRRLERRRAGRAWINGREVGGTEPRHAHLSVTHD